MDREGQALNNLSLNLSFYEKLDFVRRCHYAKDVMMQFESCLDNKERFFIKLRRKEFISPKLKLLLKFLMGRLYNSQVIMKRSKNLVKLSNQTYDNIVENTINDHSN